MQQRPDMQIKMGPPCFQEIELLDQGKRIDESVIHEICDYIDRRYDCADFRMVAVIRTLYSYTHLLDAQIADRLKNTVLNFKYWMDEPGDDGMCYWSENHQILFAGVEYLAGSLYPDELFSNDQQNGQWHKEKAEKRILNWLAYRFKYGFTEWHSNVYYEEDVAALSLLIDFAKDETIVLQSKMILDILFLDVAIFSWKGLFSSSSGRCYTEPKMHPLKQPTLSLTEFLFGWNNLNAFDFSRLSADFLLNKKYDLPEVIRSIGKDTDEVIASDSMGLDLSEIQTEFSDPHDIDTTGMFLWAMESFTNPESINLTLKIFNEWKLQKNSFLKDLSSVNIRPLLWLNLLPMVVRILNPVTQGIAIQRANTYLYKNNYYCLSTAQKYHPGKFADQQHIWQATLSKEVTVFTTHPAAPFFSDVDRNFSPDYWTGSGILPHSVQHKNLHISIYDLSPRKGLLEKKRLNFTHAYFPADKFDEVIHEDRFIFGRVNDAMISLIGRNSLRFSDENSFDLIQEGQLTYWICVVSDRTKHSSLLSFSESVKNMKIDFQIDFQSKVLSIVDEANSMNYRLAYQGGFYVNNNQVSTDHLRLQSKYATIERNPNEMSIEFQDHYLYLNFDQLIRRHGRIDEK